jgi:hypothetical protein
MRLAATTALVLLALAGAREASATGAFEII